MDTTTSSQFSRPTNPGDAVSVVVLVEDSRALAGKWVDVRDYYLPMLLESLRIADMTVPMRVWWLTSSPTFTPFTTDIADVSQCRDIPDLFAGHQSDIAISTNTIRRSMNIHASSNQQRRGHQHLIVIAASPLQGGGEGPSPMQSGIDPWIGIALAMYQEKLRLHLVLGPASETQTFHDLFTRARYVQSLPALQPWFHVDTARFSILLTGSPCRSNAVPVMSLNSMHGHSNASGSPETHEESTSASLPPSPTHEGRPLSSRRSSLPITSGLRSDGRDGGPSRTTHDSLGLVSYLQKMHGLTKKRTYGVKAGKRPIPGDIRVSTTTRPILPRLDLQISPYASPTGNDDRTDVSKSLSPPPHLRSSTSPVDRRARSRGPWLPGTPATMNGSSAPDSTTAALRSLQSMTPRLTEFHTVETPSTNSLADHDPRRAPRRAPDFMHALAYHNATSRNPGWSETQSPYEPPGTSAAASPAHLASLSDRSYSLDNTLVQSGSSLMARGSHSYYNTPLSSQTTSPLPSPSLTAPASPNDDAGDQPFIVTPEYEAFVAARFEEAVRSGAMQASMTSSLSDAVSASQPYKTSPPMPHYGSYPSQQPMEPVPNYPEAGYLSQQNDQLTSQFQQRGYQWNSGQGYTHDASRYGALPVEDWFA